MKIKTSELTGAELEWAVAKCEGNEIAIPKGCLWIPTECYSTDWAQGGPIIEREEIEISRYWNRERTHHEAWKARIGNSYRSGPTPLIAAMRCYVASKLGDSVEIPAEL